MEQLKLKRSSLHQRLLPDEEMINAFGKLNPSVSERTIYFFEVWMESRPNSMQLSDRSRKDIRLKAERLCKSLGFLPLWDYQVKGTEIRFRSESDLAMFKINWKD